MPKLTPIWLPPEIHQKFREFSVKQKHRSGYQSVEYLICFHNLVEKADKDLFKKINFTLN